TNGLGKISFDSATGVASTTATDYATQWAVYLFNVINTNIVDLGAAPLPTRLGATPTLANAPGADFATGVWPALAVTPPAPPPAYTTLQPGYPSSSTPPPPADQIANNPAIYSVTGQVVYNATSASQLMTAAVSGAGSFSYNIVAGAAFGPGNALSVDPNAVVATSSLSPTVTGNVT